MEDIVKVRRGNVILQVPKEQADEYVAKGFDIISDNGAVVKASVPSDVNILKKAYVEHLARIKELEEKLANKSKTTTKTVAEDKPKTTRKRTTKTKSEDK